MKQSKNALPLALCFGDIKKQMAELFFPHFCLDICQSRLLHMDRYLRAILHRIEKAPQNIQRDRVLLKTIEGFWLKHSERIERLGRHIYLKSAQWQRFRWMIEELRVSLFAQQMGTPFTVSEKRLNQQWLLVKEEAV